MTSISGLARSLVRPGGLRANWALPVRGRCALLLNGAPEASRAGTGRPPPILLSAGAGHQPRSSSSLISCHVG